MATRFLAVLLPIAAMLVSRASSIAQSPTTPPSGSPAATARPAASEPVAAPVPNTPPQPAAAARDPYEPKPLEYNAGPLIRVDVLMVSLSEEKALSLLTALRDAAQIQAAQTRLLEMIGRKEATLEGWPEVTVQSGLRAVTEAITEQRYPIEFEDPSTAITQGGTPDAALTAAQKALVHLRSAGLVIPSTFETRNVGATLEAEAVVSPDGTAVGLQLSPQIVRFESMRPFDAGMTDKGTKVTVEQPIFSTGKVTTSLSLRDGERRLIYVGKSGEARDRMDLFIVGAKISPAPAAKR